MKQIFLFFTLFCFSFITPAPAKGHGGGHGGGHSGGHSHSHSGAIHSSPGNTTSGNTHAAVAKRSTTKAIITRSTSPTAIAANHGRTINPNITNANTVALRGNGAVVSNPGVTENYGYYSNPYYYPYYAYPYYANPYMYNPYFGMWSFGAMFMYTPNYYPVSSPQYANGANNDQLSKQPMDGFVVFYNDTLSGAVTVAERAVSVETKDSGRNYDYHFHEKNKGLQYVTVYNDDDKQLCLTRLNGDTKRLWRIVHVGKLNIYDRRRGFIYQPEDIDINTLKVSYNGVISSLKSSSQKAAKEWLTQFVNQAYNLQLDPKKFSWKELLIYVDKLD